MRPVQYLPVPRVVPENINSTPQTRPILAKRVAKAKQHPLLIRVGALTAFVECIKMQRQVLVISVHIVHWVITQHHRVNPIAMKVAVLANIRTA